VIADVYSLAVKRHFLNLVYVRSATGEMGSTSWNTIQTTLKIAKTAPREKEAQPIEEKLLKGKAIRLPKTGQPR